MRTKNGKTMISKRKSGEKRRRNNAPGITYG